MPFFLKNSFLAIFTLISQKPVQRRGIVEKLNVVFLLLAGPVKGLIKLLICFDWAPRNVARAPNFLF